MSKHVIKYDHIDGRPLAMHKTVLWCGRERDPFDWLFLDAQHVALSVGGSVQPCKNCIKSIIKELSKELT